MSKIALAMIVKGTDSEALMLQRCLGNMSPHVDGIFITRTYERNKPSNKAVGEVAKRFKAHLSDFEWCNDFSAARNFNFAQVPKDYDYILWSDADDMWRGLEKLRTTIKKNPRVDGFGFWYLYDWDKAKRPVVVHRKTMLVKNDGCVVWRGRVHEDLVETRELNIQLVDGIDRLHLSSEDRSQQSAVRNLEIAGIEAKESPDDPRTKWNLANAQLMVADYKNAIASFENFVLTSQSDEEKYIAYQRLAEVYRGQGDALTAIRNLYIAIGIRPELPEAYFVLASLHFSIGDMDKAEYYSIMGLKKRPQPNKMIVYNPRDYDYNPMMQLANIYYNKNRPDLMLPLLKGCLKIYPTDESLKKMVRDGTREYKLLGRALEKIEELKKIRSKPKLMEAINALSPELRSHPAVCVIRNQKFVKQTSTGKDLVYYCGNTAQKWSGETFKTEGVGGSEEAVIHLAEEWAKLGWNVTVYNNCGHKEVKSGGVTYKPFWEFNYRDRQDVVIVWRTPKVLDAMINAEKIYVDLHDVTPSGEFTQERLEKVTKVLVKTRFHRSLYPNIPDNKIAVIGNGFQSYQTPEKKDPYLIINTSSPDRSLDVLPELFARVKKQVPRAKLAWAYGWDLFKSSRATDLKMMAWMEDTIKSMNRVGIKQLGRLSQEEVGKLYQRASILAYPTEFAEIDCISVKKAQAARCMPITTDFGALAESNKFGIKIHSNKNKDNWAKPYQFSFGLEDEKAKQEWVDAVVSQLKKPKPMTGMDEWVKSFGWEVIAKKWETLFNEIRYSELAKPVIENDY